ncbi:hypothetical protein EUTSA_v10029408mg, partial [Eutrema salsugineum]
IRNRYPSAPTRWYILSFEKTLGAISRLIPIPLFPRQPLLYSSVVVLGWGIYVIGGIDCKSKSKSNDVWLLDCRTNTWSKAPSMTFFRASAASGVIDGKIYVIGGRGNGDIDCSTWGEGEDDDDWMQRGLVIEEKIYAMTQFTRNVFYYSTSEGKWGRVTRSQDSEPFSGSCHCVIIEKFVFYCDFWGDMFWCEPEEFKWKRVKGLNSLWMGVSTVEPFLSVCSRPEPPFRKLRHFGENILVFWRRVSKWGAGNPEIWCAEISLERREEGDDLWGFVEWSNSLITRDHLFSHFDDVLYSVSVNL